MEIEITVIISIACAVIGAAIGIFGYKHNRKREISAGGKNEGVILTEIGYVKSGIDDIKRKQEAQDRQHIEVIARITAVEAATKQAHKRVDDHDNRIIALEGVIK